MVISFRIRDEAGNIIKEYAETKGLTLSQLLRSAVQEHIENEYMFLNDRMEVMREQPGYHSSRKKRKRRKKTAQKKAQISRVQ